MAKSAPLPRWPSKSGSRPWVIHDTYPDTAETIRAQAGKVSRQQRGAMLAKLSEARKRIKELKAKHKTAALDIKRITSTNETLRQEVTNLRAAGSGWVGMCCFPSDHVPVRSSPIFRAREIMPALIAALRQGHKS